MTDKHSQHPPNILLITTDQQRFDTLGATATTSCERRTSTGWRAWG